MQITLENSIIYAGRRRTAYRLSEPLSDRAYPTVTLVMVWGHESEYLTPCDGNCQVTDCTPVCDADARKIRAAIADLTA